MALLQIETPKGVLEIEHDGDPAELTGAVDEWVRSQESPASQSGMDIARRVPAGIAKASADAAVGVSRIAEVLPISGVTEVAKLIPGGRELIRKGREYFEGLGESAAGAYGVDESQNATIPSKLISGVSSLVPAIASGPAAPLTMAGMMGEGLRQEAEAAGATEKQKNIAFAGGATVGALSEFLLGVPALLRAAKAAKIPEATFKAISKEAAAQAVKSAGREGAQEGLEQIGQNLIASKIAAYDPERGTFENVPESVALGAAIGAPVGAAVQTAVSLDAISAQSRATAAQVNETIADVAASEPPPLVPAAPQQPPQIVEQAPAPAPASPAPTPVPVPEGVEFIEFEPNPNVSLKEGATSEGQVKFDETQSVAGITIYPDKIKLDRIFTPPKFQGKGGGTKILKALKSKGKPIETVAGEGRNYLEKEDLHAFYRKNGFRQMEGKPEGYFRWEPEQSETTETLTTKDGRKYRLAVEELPSYRGTGKPEQAVQVRALDESGNEIGYVTAKIEGDGAVITKMANVEKKWQRQGVYSELVNKLEAMGYTVTPDAAQSDDAKAFWANRRATRSESTATQQTAPTESPRSTATPATEVFPEVPQSADTEKLSAAQLKERIDILLSRHQSADNDTKRKIWNEVRELDRQYVKATGESMGPGAASAEEFIAMQTTGLKKAVVADERIQRGLDDLPPTERQSEEARVQAAEDRVDQNSTLAPSLVKRIVDDGDKAIDPDDAAVLLVERTRLMNERQQWEERVFNGEDVEIGRVELQKIENQLNRLDQAQRLAGSTWGRVGHLYQRMMRADYSLEAMESRWRGAKQDALSEKERAEVKELAETVKRTDEGLAQIETTRDQEAAEAQADQAIKQLNKDAAGTEGHDPLVTSIAERIYQRLKKAAEAADARIKERRKYIKFSSLPIDYENARDYAILAAEAIARGIRNFAKWRSEIHEKYGTDDDQYLETAWTEGNTMIDQAVERTAVPKEKKAKVKGAVKKLDPGQVRERAATSMANKYETNQKIEELRPYVRKIALSFVRDGITEREPLVDAVHGMVTEVAPDVTRRQTMDMISGYGDFAPLDMETAKVQLRDIKGQLQQIAKLEDLQKTPPSVKKTGVERRKPSHKERQLIAKVNALMRENGVGTMESLKTRLRNRTVDLQTRIAEKDFAPRPVRKIDISKDPEAVKLKAENIRAKKEFERRKEIFERQNLEGWAKAWENTKEALNTQRAIMTSFDFSGVLRQGGMVSTGIGNQKRVARAMKAMFEAAKSQQGFDRMQAELELRENAKNGNYDSSGLFLAEQGNVRLSEREEAYLSSIAERIPGVGGSQRAYVAFLNRLRADMFDGMVETLTRGSLLNKSGTASAKELKAIANYINIATGRGHLWKAEQAANTLATLFFSPRLMASRFQLLAMPFTGFRSGGGSMRTRALIAKEYAKTLSGLGLILALGAMMGATVGDDPNSSDFGKLIIGKTRVDFLFGLSQVTTLLSRLKTGKVTGTDGKETKESDSPIWKFLRNKFAPIPGAIWDARDIMVKGKAPKGHPQTLPQLALRTITPMSFGNILSIMQDNGVPRGTALFLLNLFGAGVQVYDDK